MLAPAHDMEAIGYDLCVWKESANETPVRITQIDTHGELPDLQTDDFFWASEAEWKGVADSS
jgi:hypothetical protein